MVTPWFFSFGMMLLAWLDMVDRSSWYFTLRPGSLPASSVMRRALLTDSWYQEFSGAMVANLRGLPARLPPAKSAFLPCRRLLPYSAASSETRVPSVASDQAKGARCSCHSRDRYGVPNPMTPRDASAPA